MRSHDEIGGFACFRWYIRRSGWRLLFNPLTYILYGASVVMLIGEFWYGPLMLVYLYCLVFMKAFEQLYFRDTELIKWNVWVEGLEQRLETGLPVDVTTGEIDEQAWIDEEAARA